MTRVAVALRPDVKMKIKVWMKETEECRVHLNPQKMKTREMMRPSLLLA
jgi:hypothetical protein